MPNVELLYFVGCPAYRRARKAAIDAMRAAGLDGGPAMVLVRHERDARALDFHGSPTVRIDGRDVDPEGLARSAAVGLYSRTFTWRGKTFDTPPGEMIASALRRAM